MSVTNFTINQMERLDIIKAKLILAAIELNEIDDELFELGSFPESPVSHTAYDLENTVKYIESWMKDGGIEI